MKLNYKEMGKSLAKEALGNLPYAGFVIPFIELIENLVQPDQLEAAINWVQETKSTTLLPDRSPIEPKKINAWLEDRFSHTPGEASSYAFGYPRAMIVDGRLVQFITSPTSSDHLSPREDKVYLGFNPQEKVTTLEILIADKYELDMSVGAMPGDELPILVAAPDAHITTLTLEHSKLSSPIVSFFDRYTASLEQRIGHDKAGSEVRTLSSWSEVEDVLSSAIPAMTTLLTTNQA
jgi:hypothetical protein